MKRGRIVRADRAQRLVMGIALIALNLTGIFSSPRWSNLLALVIQIELIITGLVGWCPFYWALNEKTDNTRTSEREPAKL